MISISVCQSISPIINTLKLPKFSALLSSHSQNLQIDDENLSNWSVLSLQNEDSIDSFTSLNNDDFNDQLTLRLNNNIPSFNIENTYNENQMNLIMNEIDITVRESTRYNDEVMQRLEGFNDSEMSVNEAGFL
jgi:hypothetical protein